MTSLSTGAAELPPADSGACMLIPGVYGIIIQGSLGLVSFSAICLKHAFFEKPPRPPVVFIRDLAKLALGGLWVHILNMVLAQLLFQQFANPSKTFDVCDWYLLSVTVDATLGLAINHALLNLSERVLAYQTGYYGALPRDDGEETGVGTYVKNVKHLCGREWVLQTGVWCGILTVMKLVVTFLVISFYSGPVALIHRSLSFLDSSPRTKLAAVMIFFPMVLSVFQYIVTDGFLRCDPTLALSWTIRSKAHPYESTLSESLGVAPKEATRRIEETATDVDATPLLASPGVTDHAADDRAV